MCIRFSCLFARNAVITGHKALQMLKRYTHLRAEDFVRRLE